MAESPSRPDWLALADAIAADALQAAGGDLRLALVLTAEAAAFFAAHASAGMARLTPRSPAPEGRRAEAAARES